MYLPSKTGMIIVTQICKKLQHCIKRLSQSCEIKFLLIAYRIVYIHILYILKKFNLQAYKISDIWLPAEEITHSNLEDTTFVFYNGNSHKKEHSVFCLLHGKKSSTPTHSSDVFFKHAFYLKTDGMTSAIVVVSSMIAIHSLS